MRHWGRNMLLLVPYPLSISSYFSSSHVCFADLSMNNESVGRSDDLDDPDDPDDLDDLEDGDDGEETARPRPARAPALRSAFLHGTRKPSQWGRSHLPPTAGGGTSLKLI